MSGFIIKETAKRIQDIRKQKGISAEDLAERIGVNRATYYRYESGDLKNLKFDKIQKIAEALGVYPVDLVVWEEEKPALNEDELNNELIRRLMLLTPEEIEKVDAFVQGILASRGASASHGKSNDR